MEKEKKLMQTLLDRAQDDLGMAQEAARKLDLTRSVVVQAQKVAEGECDRLKAELD